MIIKKLVKLKVILNQCPDVTLHLDNISILKSLIISQLNHLFITMPNPSDIKTLNKLFCLYFEW